jgi:hypothetical protein
MRLGKTLMMAPRITRYPPAVHVPLGEWGQAMRLGKTLMVVLTNPAVQVSPGEWGQAIRLGKALMMALMNWVSREENSEILQFSSASTFRDKCGGLALIVISK